MGWGVGVWVCGLAVGCGVFVPWLSGAGPAEGVCLNVCVCVCVRVCVCVSPAGLYI